MSGNQKIGDDWIPISGDLTRNENKLNSLLWEENRMEQRVDVGAMSNYNTITSLEFQWRKAFFMLELMMDSFISENGGESWRKIPVTDLGLAPRTFVNDIKADLFDSNTVYVALDNHGGDYSPYLFKSTDKV